MALEIPLEPGDPEQRISVTLAGDQRELRVRWNTITEKWYLDVYEADGTLIVPGLCILLGVAIGRWVDHPVFTGTFVAVDTLKTGRDPGFGDLGGRVRLWYLTASDLLAAQQAPFAVPKDGAP